MHLFLWERTIWNKKESESKSMIQFSTSNELHMWKIQCFISLDWNDSTTRLTSHLPGLKASGSSYVAGFKWTAGGQTMTAQPAGIVYPVSIAICKNVKSEPWKTHCSDLLHG